MRVIAACITGLFEGVYNKIFSVFLPTIAINQNIPINDSTKIYTTIL